MVLGMEIQLKTAFCFDLDGTITSAEILPELGKKLGKYDELMELTNQTLSGSIPFEESFRKRIEILKEIPIKEVVEVVNEIPLFSRVVDFIRSNSEDSYIVTGNLDVWVQDLVGRWNCGLRSSIGKVEGDRLLGIESIVSKGESIKEIRSGYQRVISVGDGAADCAMFEFSDFGIAFGATHPPSASLIKSADFVVFEEESLCLLLKTL